MITEEKINVLMEHCKGCDSKEPCDKLYDKTDYNWYHKTFRP